MSIGFHGEDCSQLPPIDYWTHTLFYKSPVRYGTSLLCFEVILNGAWQAADRKDYNYWWVDDGKISDRPGTCV
jgi:hypothetical protein